MNAVLASSLAAALGIDPSAAPPGGGAEALRREVEADAATRLPPSDGSTQPQAVRHAVAPLPGTEQLPRDCDLGEVTAERREREIRDISSPSALIRRAQREWPDACRKVAAAAEQLGLPLGEAWRRAIFAGVDAMAEGAGA